MRTSGQLRVVFGMSCWFMPVGTNEDETERRVGRAITMGSGDEEQKVGEFTAWDPPHRFVAEGHAWGPDAPTVAHEWTVEARAGGTCVVRVVNSYFADTNDWDNQLTDMEGGWRRFFRILQLYMTHFRGQTCSAIHLMAPTTMPEPKVWETRRIDQRQASLRSSFDPPRPPLGNRAWLTNLETGMNPARRSPSHARQSAFVLQVVLLFGMTHRKRSCSAPETVSIRTASFDRQRRFGHSNDICPSCLVDVVTTSARDEVPIYP